MSTVNCIKFEQRSIFCPKWLCLWIIVRYHNISIAPTQTDLHLLGVDTLYSQAARFHAAECWWIQNCIECATQNWLNSKFYEILFIISILYISFIRLLKDKRKFTVKIFIFKMESHIHRQRTIYVYKCTANQEQFSKYGKKVLNK